MKNNKTVFAVMSLYATVMLVICLIALYAASTKSGVTTVETMTQTEKEYVYLPVIYDGGGDSDAPDFPVKLTVKQHNGIIGVFDENGGLVEVIDVYVKTLPETDRRLLEEGFTITSAKQLASIIEDYTG